jgi:hypothetical protein
MSRGAGGKPAYHGVMHVDVEGSDAVVRRAGRP